MKNLVTVQQLPKVRSVHALSFVQVTEIAEAMRNAAPMDVDTHVCQQHQARQMQSLFINPSNVSSFCEKIRVA